MKHIFFQDNNAINFAGNGAVNFVGAKALMLHHGLGGNGNLIFLPAHGVPANGAINVFGHGNPILGEAINLINNPDTTSLDLSGTNISDNVTAHIINVLPQNQNITLVNFSNNPMITNDTVGNVLDNCHNQLVSVDFTNCGVNLGLVGQAPVFTTTIYQSPLVSCRFGDTNLFEEKERGAKDIIKLLYSFISSGAFDVTNLEHISTLIHFAKSPKAQKALKWLSENSPELNLLSQGEDFVLKVNKFVNNNILILKGICKELNEESLLFLPQELLLEILSYVDFDDILSPSQTITIEEVDTDLVGEVYSYEDQ